MMMRVVLLLYDTLICVWSLGCFAIGKMTGSGHIDRYRFGWIIREQTSCIA